MARAPRWRRHSPAGLGHGEVVSFTANGVFLGNATAVGNVARLVDAPVDAIPAGVYPSGIRATFAGNDTHTGAVGQGTLTVVKATPVITITAGTVQYHGLPHAAAVTALGGGGMALSPVVVSYNGSTEAPANPGVYAVQAFYAGDSNHQERSSSATLTITESIAPTVAIASPHDGATYALGQVVTPKFTCADNVGIASCIPSASAAVPTSSAGIYSYVVTARDLAGNISVKTVLYSVRASAERQWQPAAPLPAAQYFGNAITLANGLVLVAGGTDPANAATRRAFLYDPATNAWSALPDMWAARSDSAAVALANGRVLMTGGITSGGGRTASAEVFDPASRQWSLVRPMIMPRNRHTLTLLADGKVLATGGYLTHADPYQQYQQSAEIYDPATDTWIPAGNIGGTASGALRLAPAGRASADRRWRRLRRVQGNRRVFNPSTRTFSYGPGLAERRYFHSAATLPDGRILIAGGMNFATQFSDAWAFNPATGQWQAAGQMSRARLYFPMTLMADGRVLAASGYSGTSAIPNTDVFNPITNSWQSVPSMTAPRYLPSIAPLKDGGAIVVGGSGTGTLAVAEVWNGARFIPTISVMPVSGVLGQAIDVRVITNIPDKPVVLTVSGVSYGPLSTDASGSVVFSGVSTAGLTPGHNENAIVATLEPGETTAGGRATGAIEIIAAATQLVMAPLTAKFGDTILLTASLKTTAGSPVANQLVRFDVLGNGTYDVSSSTDTAGKATATLTWAAAQALGIKVGSYNVIASFSGLAGSFTGATTTASLTIVDTVAPIITVLRPPAGAVFARDSLEATSFACSDDTGAVSECVTIDGASPGALLNTSTPGVYKLDLRARDASGNVGMRRSPTRSPIPPRSRQPTSGSVTTTRSRSLIR